MSRLHPSLRRWLDMLFLTAVSTALALLLSPLLFLLRDFVSNSWPTPFSFTDPAYNQLAILLVFAFVLAPLIYTYHRAGGLHWRHFFVYPGLQLIYWPTYFPAIFSLELLYFLQPWLNIHFYPQDFPHWGLAVVASPLILCMTMFLILFLVRLVCIILGAAYLTRLANWVLHKPAPPLLSYPTLDDLLNDLPRFNAWIYNDSPITDTSQDYFGVRQMAEEFANLILAHPDATFGLLGPKGSGKSSIIKLVFKHLAGSSVPALDSAETSSEKPHRFITCSVGQWGRKDLPATAAILQAAIEELSKYVDVLAVANLPEHYLNAISHARTPWYLAIFLYLCRRHSPDNELTRLNNILRIVKHHLIIAVEDLDRNEPEDEFRHKYTQLAALLDRIRGTTPTQTGAQAPGTSSPCDHLTFILAADHAAFDFSRLCHYRRDVLPMPPESFGKVMHTFFDRHLTSDTVVDPRSEMARARIWHHWDPADWSPLVNVPANVHTFSTADLYALLRHPRRLKQALRDTLETWLRLQGEIDSNDLFLCNVIRACSFRAFDFIQTYHDTLAKRSLPQDQLSQLAENWNRSVNDCNASDRDYLADLVGELFPNSPRGTSDMAADQYPQGVDQTRHWQRAYLGYVPHSDLRDQEVFKAMRAWSAHPLADDPLPSSLENDSGFFKLFEGFHSRSHHLHPDLRLDSFHARQLTEQVFARHLDRHRSQASRETCPAFWPLHELVNRHTRSTDFTDWAWRQIEQALPISLRFALDFEIHWCQIHPDFSKAQHDQLRRKLFDWISSHWMEDPSLLTQSLANSSWPHVGTLHGLIIHQMEAHTPAIDLLEWAPTVRLILTEMASNPAAMLPHLCALITNQRPPLEMTKPNWPVTNQQFDLNIALLEHILPKTQDRDEFSATVIKAIRRNPAVPDFVRPLVTSIPRLLDAWRISYSQDRRDRPHYRR